MEPTPLVAPAPWQLTGEGVIWLYAIPEEFNRKHGFLADFQASAYVGRVGAVMYVNYHTSGVGPYQELLYIPGMFRLGRKLVFSISKTYVSTQSSVWNGRRNWDIPKEPADFRFERTTGGTLEMEVSAGSESIFAAQVTPFGPQLPFTTKIFPWGRIVQRLDHELLLTKPEAKGHLQLASTTHLTAEPRYFPPVQELKPLAVVAVQDFKMVFPVAEVL
ncbi:hypothetical protein EFA69_17590 [Rufibacter immobilis]|uniref:Acetoacetate decarboxylase n=1 Tax=Rufibacter immobilis TaxID=1348778 RepID=A0A3M9MSL8_9BACT|nr:acetoacetate decarboxylase family protein [Rufibacter immobilis]RNI27903.1 hypothetical protein EFA69_17590 [Rufibacter immobilis]